MLTRGLALAGLLVIAYLFFIVDFDHPIREKVISYGIFQRRHNGGGAPAPLLAAGVPAFMALAGGAAVAPLIRRLRRHTSPVKRPCVAPSRAVDAMRDLR